MTVRSVLRVVRGCANTTSASLPWTVRGTVVMWLPLVSAARLAAGPYDSGSQPEAGKASGPVTGAGSFQSVPGGEVKDGTKTTSEGKNTFLQINWSISVLKCRQRDFKFVDEHSTIFFNRSTSYLHAPSIFTWDPSRKYLILQTTSRSFSPHSEPCG